MRPRPLLAAVFAAATFATAFAQETPAPVTIGSSVPPIAVKTWLKGTPVTSFEPGKTYVVEFWATWCGPCIQSIPHVTKLAKENPDVTFMGIGIWEDEGPQLKAFVDKMGEKMGYNVGYSGNKDGMAVSWMDAAGQNGIPSAFIVKDAQVVWIGHPMEMDEPLAAIKAGTFDSAAFKKKFDEEAAASRKQVALQRQFRAITKDFDSGKRTEAKAALATLVAANPEVKPQADSITYGWLAIENPKEWEAKTGEMLAKTPPDADPILNFAAQSVAKPEGYPLARKTIGMVLKAMPNDFNAHIYARYIYGKTGDSKLALQSVDKLLELYPTSPAKDNADLKAALLKERGELAEKIGKTSK